MNHLMTLFDFERGPDGIAILAVLGLLFLVWIASGIWIFIDNLKEDKK